MSNLLQVAITDYYVDFQKLNENRNEDQAQSLERL